MADKTQEPKEVETTIEEVEKTKVEKCEKPVDKAAKDEKAAENGDVKEDADDDSKDGKEKNGDAEKEAEEDKCSVKRKSTGGGDATDSKPADGATPEKKAKLDEPAEAEAKSKAEVAA